MFPERIGLRMPEIPDWTVEETQQAIGRHFYFDTPDEAMSFVLAVVSISRSHSHMPAIDIRDRQVKLRLTTPQADGLTDEDFVMAKKFDAWADNPWGD